MLPAHLQPYFVIGIIIIGFVLLYRSVLKPALAFLAMVVAFLVAGVLSGSDVLQGFGNPSIASIILLLLITGALRKNFNIEILFDWLFKGVSSYRTFLLRMMGQVAVLSSIINNTPIVAILTPYVFSWGQRHNISPSKLLLPLSYATIMGGMITIIGTSTTLVLNGFMLNAKVGTLPYQALLTLGAMVSITGILFLTGFAWRLLPNRQDALAAFKANAREHVVEVQLEPQSKIIGQNVQDAGLRNLKGLYLVEILRNEKSISPVSPSETVQQDDILLFAGDTDDIVDLTKAGKGLRLPKATRHHTNNVEAIEAVVNTNSGLIGSTPKESEFRNNYDAAIVAIHRNGEKLSGKIGQIKLQAGDVLLLFAGRRFNKRTANQRDFYVISKVREIARPSKRKSWSLAAIAAIAVVLVAANVFDLFTSLLIIFATIAAMGMSSVEDIRKDLDLNLISMLVFSIALGQAMINTGAGKLVAGGLISVFEPYGILAILIGLLLLTTLLTSFVSNVGAIAITFPLALELSQQLGINGMPFYVGIAYAASAAFLTPVGYQTNLIVYGPGNYNFKDFVRVGLPVTVLYLAVTILGLCLLYGDVLLG